MEPETVTVTWAAEYFQPAGSQYNGYTVGPFSTTTHIRPGETIEQASLRAYKGLEAIADMVFLRKRNQFVEHFKVRGE